jgi:acylphosphatase
MSRVQIKYSGNVQGVGFRWKVSQIAKSYKLTGYVQNLSDGKVELLLEGEESEVQEMSKDVANQLRDYWTSFEREDKLGKAHHANFSIKEY